MNVDEALKLITVYNGGSIDIRLKMLSPYRHTMTSVGGWTAKIRLDDGDYCDYIGDTPEEVLINACTSMLEFELDNRKEPSDQEMD